jgi:hypothetical protein
MIFDADVGFSPAFLSVSHMLPRTLIPNTCNLHFFLKVKKAFSTVIQNKYKTFYLTNFMKQT